MKSFFEEYGFVILAAIVVILLIAMCTPIGNLVKSQITGIVDSFANKTNTKLNAVDAGENTAYLRKGSDGYYLDISSANATDNFYATATYKSGGVDKVNRKVVLDAATATFSDNDETKQTGIKAGSFKISGTIDAGSTLQFKIVNVGTGEVFYSNAMTIAKANMSV